MIEEFGIYSRNYRSALTPAELVYAYSLMRNLYDPIPLKGDLHRFSHSVENMGIFRSVFNGANFNHDELGYFEGHVHTLSLILNRHILLVSEELLQLEKPVAHMPGSADWEYDIEGATRKEVSRARVGLNGQFAESDFFQGDFEPTSADAEMEIFHQFLNCENLKKRIQGPCGEDQLKLIMTAKDIMYMTLMKTYLSALRSRALK